MKRIVLAVAVVLIPAMAGCPKNAYHDGVVIEHDASAAVKAYQQAVETEFQNGRISQAERAQQERFIEKIGIAGQKLNADMQAAATNTTVTADLSSLTSAVGDAAGAFVQNPQSQATLKGAVLAVQAVLKNLSDFIASQKGN
jgi:hypothetical protein